MKKLIIKIASVLTVIVSIFGFLLPYLFSAKDNLYVILGVIVLIATFAFLPFMIKIIASKYDNS